MKMLISLVAVVVVAGMLFWLSRYTILFDRAGGIPRAVTPKAVAVSQIPNVVEQLRSKGIDHSFAAFAFSSKGEQATDDTVVNLQYSVEGPSTGLDWVLIAPRNKSDKDKVAAFIERQKYRLLEKEANGIRYLRVEDGDIATLGIQLVEELYHLEAHDEMALFVDKFDFQP